MNLDDLQKIQQLDATHMLEHIDGLPEQFETAWEHAQTQLLPTYLPNIRQVIISGMGGSAIGGDLLAAVAGLTSPIPILIIRGYDLPAWVQGEHTLVIASSFSGNTEETLAAYDVAKSRGAHLLALTTGGKLAAKAKQDRQTLWSFSTNIDQPRAAIGWSFGLLLGLASRAGWMQNVGPQVAEAVANLKAYREKYGVNVPAMTNPAKRQAGQYMGRVPVFIGAGIFEPVARRWKGQLNENSKSFAVHDPIPEMNHNAVVGVNFPQEVLSKLSVMFIASPQYDHPRNHLRHDLTLNLLLQNGIMIDRFTPAGNSPIAQMMHAIQFGDYLSFYTAIAYGADPAVIAPIMELKQALADHQ